MNSDQKLWLATIIAIVIICTAPVACTINETNAIAAAITKGVDPVLVKCALASHKSCK